MDPTTLEVVLLPRTRAFFYVSSKLQPVKRTGCERAESYSLSRQI